MPTIQPPEVKQAMKEVREKHIAIGRYEEGDIDWSTGGGTARVVALLRKHEKEGKLSEKDKGYLHHNLVVSINVLGYEDAMRLVRIKIHNTPA